MRILHGVESPQLGNTRHLLVYLPPSYASSDRAYPVLYAHDGDNLFDEDASFAGEWRMDETLEELAHEGLEAIVVGVPNVGGERMVEYSPFDSLFSGARGRGEAYVDFLVDTVRPLVAESFRIAREPERTGLVGSSAGGTISLYGAVARPDVFGLAGALSPAFWWIGDAMFDFVAGSDVHARIWLDCGTREGGDNEERSAAYVHGVERMTAILREKGLGDDRLRVVVEQDAPHDEAAWARRLPDVLRFLLR